MNRRLFAAALAASPAVLVGSGGVEAAAARSTKHAAADDGAQAAAIISRIRGAQGLPAVRIDATLTAAARHQANSNAAEGALSHGDFAGRVHSFGIRGPAAENLAYGSDDVAGAIRQWENSSAHYANLLLPGARRLGIAHADRGRTRYWAMVIG